MEKDNSANTYQDKNIVSIEEDILFIKESLHSNNLNAEGLKKVYLTASNLLYKAVGINKDFKYSNDSLIKIFQPHIKENESITKKEQEITTNISKILRDYIIDCILKEEEDLRETSFKFLGKVFQAIGITANTNIALRILEVYITTQENTARGGSKSKNRNPFFTEYSIIKATKKIIMDMIKIIEEKSGSCSSLMNKEMNKENQQNTDILTKEALKTRNRLYSSCSDKGEVEAEHNDKDLKINGSNNSTAFSNDFSCDAGKSTSSNSPSSQEDHPPQINLSSFAKSEGYISTSFAQDFSQMQHSINKSLTESQKFELNNGKGCRYFLY